MMYKVITWPNTTPYVSSSSGMEKCAGKTESSEGTWPHKHNKLKRIHSFRILTIQLQNNNFINNIKLIW